MTCEARKGFLTLSDCQNPAATQCSNCARSMCPAHLAPQSGFTMCFDCAAANQNMQPGENDELWAHRYRDDYRTTTGYTPIYMSRHHYYDSQDSRSFDQRGPDTLMDDDDRGGFGDS